MMDFANHCGSRFAAPKARAAFRLAAKISENPMDSVMS